MIPGVLRRLLGEETVYECRDCGRTLAEGDDACPDCGSEEIAVYEIDR